MQSEIRDGKCKVTVTVVMGIGRLMDGGGAGADEQRHDPPRGSGAHGGVGDGIVLRDRELHNVAQGLRYSLGGGGHDLLALPDSNGNLSLLVSHRDDGTEAQDISSLDDLRHPPDLDEPLLEPEGLHLVPHDLRVLLVVLPVDARVQESGVQLVRELLLDDRHEGGDAGALVQAVDDLLEIRSARTVVLGEGSGNSERGGTCRVSPASTRERGKKKNRTEEEEKNLQVAIRCLWDLFD